MAGNRMNKKDKELMQRLYMELGVDELGRLTTLSRGNPRWVEKIESKFHNKKRDYLNEWCETKGENINRIIYNLIFDTPSKEILKELDDDQRKSS